MEFSLYKNSSRCRFLIGYQFRGLQSYVVSLAEYQDMSTNDTEQKPSNFKPRYLGDLLLLHGDLGNKSLWSSGMRKPENRSGF